MALLRRRKQQPPSRSLVKEGRSQSVPAIREMLARGDTRILLDAESSSFVLRPNHASAAETDGRSNFAGGTNGLPQLLSQLLATGRTYREVLAQEGVRIRLTPDAQEWVFDADLVWRGLAGAAAGEEVERRIVDSGVVAQEIAAASGTLWYCRIDTTGWLILSPNEETEKPSQEVVRRIQRQRRTLRSLGLPVDTLRTRRVPESTIAPGVEVYRVAVGTSVMYWVRTTVTRIARDHGGSLGGVAVAMIHELLSQEGLAGVTATLPRSPGEIRYRYAVRTIREMIRQRGTATRVLAETAYRSGELYRAMAVVVAGLPPAGRGNVRESLGRKRWQQLYDHSKTVLERNPRVAPWDQWAQAADLVIQDLSTRMSKRGMALPELAAAVVRQLYLVPRTDRFQRVWKQQISQGSLASALQEARLSQLRRRLRTIPRLSLLLAACGEVPEVAQRISAIYSRRGRRMFREDLEVLESGILRGETTNWEQLLAARQTVLRIAQESS